MPGTTVSSTNPIQIILASSIADSEESVRVVKSARTRAFEAFESNEKAIRNAMKNVRSFSRCIAYFMRA